MQRDRLKEHQNNIKKKRTPKDKKRYRNFEEEESNNQPEVKMKKIQKIENFQRKTQY